LARGSLDEWFALKVGVTRTNSPAALPSTPRLSEDPGLTRAAVCDHHHEFIVRTAPGSVHGFAGAGKFADFIVLDRNVLKIPRRKSPAKVLQTVAGAGSSFKRRF